MTEQTGIKIVREAVLWGAVVIIVSSMFINEQIYNPFLFLIVILIIEYGSLWIKCGKWIIINILQPFGESIISLYRKLFGVCLRSIVAPYEDREYNYKVLIKEMQNQLKVSGKITDEQFEKLTYYTNDDVREVEEITEQIVEKLTNIDKRYEPYDWNSITFNRQYKGLYEEE